MKSTAHINIRIEPEYEEMLEELLRVDAKEAMKFNRLPMNKTQVIKKAIKEYYGSKMSRSSANVYADQISNSIEPMLMSLFKTLDERQLLLLKKLESMNQKELLYLELMALDSEHKTHTKENRFVFEKLNYSEDDFEDEVKKKLQKYLAKDSKK